MNFKGTDEVKKVFKLHHWHTISFILVVYDFIAVCAAYFAGLWLRFDGTFSMIPREFLIPYAQFILPYALICIVVFAALRLYNSIWRFASYNELYRVIWSSLITCIIHIIGITVFLKRMPISYYLFGAIIQFVLILGARFSYRFVLLERSKRDAYLKRADAKKVMVIGAGAAGQMIIRELMHVSITEDRVCCIIDDNPNKWNRDIEGVPVIGGRDSIMYGVGKYGIEKIYVAIPSASAEARRDILNICKETGCEIKNLPGVYQFVNGEVSVKAMKPVSVEDLLGRETIKVDVEQILEELRDKTILVTGGGGSIGSELCRQIALKMPKQLIIFDMYENNAYDIQQELKRKHPELKLTVLIGSVRDSRKLQQLFATYHPDIVYHAAAHKHVPLMEDSPCEAIKNNAIGTYKTAYAAMMNGCKRFVLISTDKAVNPTNVMGASKRLCEMVIQSFDRMVKAGTVDRIPMLYAHAEDEAASMEWNRLVGQKIETEFVAVRFGNVLGSNGSVIPLFKKQIEEGGPVTVTHPDIIRYFMTIPEAVSLVLQAGVYAKGGEIFVLDMGSPMKIDTLARNLIQLSGLRPDVDIAIEYTGLRPGEKLYEEKLMAEEGLEKTPNQLIHIGAPVNFDTRVFLEQMQVLMKRCYSNDTNIRELIKEMVSTYQPID